MCCKDLCSRGITKVQAYVLLGFCVAVAIFGIPLTLYGFKWDARHQAESNGSPVLYHIYDHTIHRFSSYSSTETIYSSTLSWAGFLALIPALFGMMAIVCGKKIVKMVMIVTIVSFVSLTCKLTAASIAGSMRSDMNLLQSLKDQDRCSFINGNWSSYCECKLNTYEPTTRKVARITAQDAMDTKGFGAPTKMLMSLMFHTSINKQKNSEGLNRVTMKLLTDFCVSQPIPSLDMTTEGDGCSVITKFRSLLLVNLALSLTEVILTAILSFVGLLVCCSSRKEYVSVDGENKNLNAEQPRPFANPTDAPPAYTSIGSHDSHYQVQSRGFNEGHQGYASYSPQQPMYSGAAGAATGPSAPPVQDIPSEKEEKRGLLDD